ncbi:hypothetical protein FB45DRAFT_1029287 [Roridomyces roridus]|uniref:Zn(2)-C6 fungal-type domain-containing protein n=1 Tax=Roridomyces roridus TaxID=1738132 RepID=A0AAD7BPB2_9AGAR|nr:hypothetical protein FB45DRAFT_1029287 [Roridomyces roridus]
MSKSTASSSNQADPTLALSKRRRTFVACSNCRKRKIRCVTSEENANAPCARCRMKNLTCEYHRWAGLLCPTDEETPTESAGGSSSQGTPSVQLQPPPSSSNMQAPASIHQWQQPQQPYAAIYELQAADARRYLERRNLNQYDHSASPNQPASTMVGYTPPPPGSPMPMETPNFLSQPNAGQQQDVWDQFWCISTLAVS